MTARYKVIVTPKGQADSRAIQDYLVERSGPEVADSWEEGFLTTFLIGLSKFPHLQIVRPATNTNPIEVRKSLYRSTKRGAGYYVFYTIEEFARPNPEPTTDYQAGIVWVVAVRPSAMAPLTQEEIDKL
jgi:plasmid stabilization system protein ParE